MLHVFCAEENHSNRGRYSLKYIFCVEGDVLEGQMALKVVMKITTWQLDVIGENVFL